MASRQWAYILLADKGTDSLSRLVSRQKIGEYKIWSPWIITLKASIHVAIDTKKKLLSSLKEQFRRNPIIVTLISHGQVVYIGSLWDHLNFRGLAATNNPNMPPPPTNMLEIFPNHAAATT